MMTTLLIIFSLMGTVPKDNPEPKKKIPVEACLFENEVEIKVYENKIKI